MSTRNKDIDELIAHLERYVPDIDDTSAANRRACWTLIRRAAKRTEDPVGSIKMLISTVFSGHKSMEFHARAFTSFPYLVKYGTRVANDIRIARSASPAAKNRNGHDIIRGMYSGAGTNDPQSHQP